jgi:hypothetical protein
MRLENSLKILPGRAERQTDPASRHRSCSLWLREVAAHDGNRQPLSAAMFLQCSTTGNTHDESENVSHARGSSAGNGHFGRQDRRSTRPILRQIGARSNPLNPSLSRRVAGEVSRELILDEVSILYSVSSGIGAGVCLVVDVLTPSGWFGAAGSTSLFHSAKSPARVTDR